MRFTHVRILFYSIVKKRKKEREVMMIITIMKGRRNALKEHVGPTVYDGQRLGPDNPDDACRLPAKRIGRLNLVTWEELNAFIPPPPTPPPPPPPHLTCALAPGGKRSATKCYGVK